MMPIKFSEAQLSADEQIKQKAATQQMQDMVALLGNGAKYATLTVSDRDMLLKKGFAPDLVDNVIFFTERNSHDTRDKSHDQLVVGFTHAAFDSSIYACDSIRKQLKQTHLGRCAYCESQIDQTQSDFVSHYRPAWGVVEENRWNRQAYYELAYQQRNLLYSCRACHEQHKSSHFPLSGARAPSVALESEQPLLLNPYDEDPRQFIRFNPINGHAYPFDELTTFCARNLGLSAEQSETYIWEKPSVLSSPAELSGLGLEPSNEHPQWRDYIQSPDFQARGQTTIDVLGLNRPELIQARLAHLRNLYAHFLAQSLGNDGNDAIKGYLNSVMDDTTNYGSYRSLSLDAINTWQRSADCNYDWFAGYQSQLGTAEADTTVAVSPQFASRFQYMVLENELALEGKRRIVCLHGSDYLYGSDRKVKTVFLPIEWQQDFNNVIKVSSSSLLWEASFSELAETEPVALQNLFANNEIWAEGNYAALA